MIPLSGVVGVAKELFVQDLPILILLLLHRREELKERLRRTHIEQRTLGRTQYSYSYFIEWSYFYNYTDIARR